MERPYGPLEPARCDPLLVDPLQVGLPPLPQFHPVEALDLPLPALFCWCPAAFGCRACHCAKVSFGALPRWPAALAGLVRPALLGMAFGCTGGACAAVPRMRTGGTMVMVARGEAPGAESAGANPM